jgi:general secretion pathway protein M
MIAAWWNGLVAQERRIVAGGGLLALLMLGWAFAWHPLALKRADLEQGIANQRSELAYVRAGAAQIEQQRATGARAGGQRAGKSLLALADTTARAGGLGDALKRVEPVGAKGARVSFESARFDALVGWLESLARDYGVEAIELSTDRAEGAGLVNARVTLQDAP